jgi:excisionase family DNA binding protein
MAVLYSGVNMEMDSTGHYRHEEAEAFYTLKEAAQLLRIAERTLRRLLQAGKMRGYRLGRQWRIPRSDIDRMIAPEEEYLHDRHLPNEPYGDIE